MRYLNFIPLLLLVSYVAAAEPEAATGGGDTGWIAALGAAILALATWLISLVRKKIKVDVEKTEIDKQSSIWEQRNALIDNRVIPFAVSSAEHWLMKNILPLVTDAADGQGFRWRKHLEELKRYLKDQVLKKFARENTDLLEHLAEEDLRNILDRVVNEAVVALPGRLAAFVPQSVLDQLKDAALGYVKEQIPD